MNHGTVATIVGLLTAMAAPAAAKETHFGQLRVLLMAKSARCTSCHAATDGKSLNEYGKRLAAMPTDDPLAAKIMALEAEPDAAAAEDERRRKDRDRDVDQDGVYNWIEFLAGTDPSKPDDKPPADTVRRIETVVSCKICHTATGLPGEGLAANPHNELGELLATTAPPVRESPRPRGIDALRAAAERLPILSRLALVAKQKKRPKGSPATYWERIQMLHASTDAADAPSREQVRDFRKESARQRSRRTRDANRGLKADAHALDGFLLDGEGLD